MDGVRMMRPHHIMKIIDFCTLILTLTLQLQQISWMASRFIQTIQQISLFSNRMGFNAWLFGCIRSFNLGKKERIRMLIHPDKDSKHSILMNYLGKILAHILGMDFQWQDAAFYFGQMDRIITKAINYTLKVEMIIQYSTPKQQALYEQNIIIPFKQKTSSNMLINIGHIISQGTQVLQEEQIDISKKRTFFIPLSKSALNLNLFVISRTKKIQALGTAQLHDKITGTGKQDVQNDYTKMIEIAQQNMNKKSNTLLNSLSITQSFIYFACNFNGSNICHSLFDPLIINQNVILTPQTVFQDDTQTIKIQPQIINVDKDKKLFGKFVHNYNFYFSFSSAYFLDQVVPSIWELHKSVVLQEVQLNKFILKKVTYKHRLQPLIMKNLLCLCWQMRALQNQSQIIISLLMVQSTYENQNMDCDI